MFVIVGTGYNPAGCALQQHVDFCINYNLISIASSLPVVMLLLLPEEVLRKSLFRPVYVCVLSNSHFLLMAFLVFG